jgi:hypothetical protein
MSRGRLGAVGNDAASSAQSKRVGGGEMDRLRGVWGELGCAVVDGGLGSEWGVLRGLDGTVGDTA